MEIFVAADNIFSPLGFTTAENLLNIQSGTSGIREITDEAMSPYPFFGACFEPGLLNNKFHTIENGKQYTRLEKMFILSISDALGSSNIDIASPDTLLILCTTKGNIDLFEPVNQGLFEENRKSLHGMANTIGAYFKVVHEPLVVSNACISGMLGIITASRLLNGGQYKHIVVSGGDIISAFTISGFQAFKAVSPLPCRPYDTERSGVSLGEGCGTIVLTNDHKFVKASAPVLVTGGATSNDANHISGPSRDGSGLYLAIKNALRESQVDATAIDYISGHGTATLYNDEMEAKAIALASLEHAPLNSFKGYFGHTLGAAGVIESVATVHALYEDMLVGSFGFSHLGVSANLNVLKSNARKKISRSLKTGAGFGGCNAAIVFAKRSGQ